MPTITRATTATVMGYAPAAVLADGQTLLTVASGELRFQGARRVSEGVWSTVDADGVAIPAATLDGAVVEAAATNLCLQSNAFTTTWTALGAPGIAQNVTGPDNATSAWTISDASAVAALGVTQNITLTAAAYTFSIFIKKTSGAAAFPILEALTGTVTANCTVDTNNGVATVWTAYTGRTMLASASARCTSYNTNFWLVELTYTGTAAVYAHSIFCAGTTNATQATGIVDVAVEGSNVFYGAQVELGSYATTYIPTTTAAVTRNKDILDDQVSGNLTAAAGTAVFSWTPSHAPSGTVALAGSYVDASNYTAVLHDATNYIFRKRIAGVNYDATLTASFTSGTTYDIALRWGASGSQIAVDGVLGTANTTGVEGVQYGKLTGVAGTYFSTPDSAASSITGDIDIRVKAALTDWTPVAGQQLVSKYIEATNQRSYMIRVVPSGKLEAYGSSNGIADTLLGVSTVATGFTDGTPYWVRMTLDCDDGAGNRVCKYYTSNDGDSWTQLGATITTAGTIALFDSTSSVLVGALSESSGELTGNIYRVKIYNGIDGTLAVDFNPADYTHGTTWTSSATGEVYTMNGNAAVWPAVKLSTRWQWGADGNSLQQAGAAFDEKHLATAALTDSQLQVVAP